MVVAFNASGKPGKGRGSGSSKPFSWLGKKEKPLVVAGGFFYRGERGDARAVVAFGVSGKPGKGRGSGSSEPFSWLGKRGKSSGLSPRAFCFGDRPPGSWH